LSFQFDATSFGAQNLDIIAVDSGRKRCEASLSRAAELADQDGVQFLVVAIPAKESAYYDAACTVLPYARTRPRDTFCGRVEAHCQAEGIRCLNLLPVLAEAAERGEQAYFSVDGHFNARGHEIAAEAIHRFVVDNRLLERHPAPASTGDGAAPAP
jgi:hypothetical protein